MVRSSCRHNHSLVNAPTRSACIITATILALLTSSTHPAHCQDDPIRRTSISAGFGMLVYQSGFGMGRSTGFELSVTRTLSEQVRGEAGFRMGIDPARPDVFLRMMVTQRIGRWRASVGIESGYTDRAFFESDSELLRETREAMTADIGHGYIASHIEPLCFGTEKRWDISVLELDIGTHYKDIGSTVRLNVNFLRVRWYL